MNFAGKVAVVTRGVSGIGKACAKEFAEPNAKVTVIVRDESPTTRNRVRSACPSDDSHAKVRALGSLAHEIMETGATAVVAMRYNVYVETAAQFMADLYGPLAQGYTVGEAVAVGRKQLAAQPLRSIAFDPRPLQDWPVRWSSKLPPSRCFPNKPRERSSPLPTRAPRAATTA